MEGTAGTWATWSRSAVLATRSLSVHAVSSLALDPARGERTMVASIAGDEVRDNRTKTFAHEATLQLQQPGYGFPCRVDSSSGQLGVFATRRILAGEVVAVERPLALTVNRAVYVHTCAVCLADSRDAGHAQWSRKCGACEAHYYCGEACEVAGLARHRGVECDALAALRSDTEDDDLKDQVAQTVRILADR